MCMAFIFSMGINYVAAAPGDVIYVNGTGGDDTANGYTWATAKLSIKNGIETVNSNGNVYIANGEYTGVDNTGITISKNITITGQSSNNTIINGEGKSQIFHVYPSDVNVTIQNLRFINGYSAVGGAITNDANCTIKDCTFVGNTATTYGGAIANFELNCDVENCTFISNKASSNKYGGGAICNAAGTMSINGCNFINNNAYYEGGAILNGVDCTANFNRFYGNTAKFGTAIGNYGKINAENNWWGSNKDPQTILNLIMINSGSLSADHWVILSMDTNPKTINNGKTSTITADLNHINGGGQLVGGQIPDGPVTLNIPWGSFTNPSINHSITANTKNGLLTSIFYANQGPIDPSYNPVKVAATADEYTTNNNESAYIKINKSSDIKISETVNKTRPNVGDTILFTVTVHNQGMDGTTLQIKDIMPKMFANIVSKTTKGTYADGIWTLELAPGETAYLTLQGTVTSQMTGKETTNTASILNSENSASATISPETNNITVQKTIPSTISKANSNVKTIPMQPTGAPLIPLLIGALMMVAGIKYTRKS
jgi:uncharacterized repeat protein (TIGR01451 family)